METSHTTSVSRAPMRTTLLIVLTGLLIFAAGQTIASIMDHSSLLSARDGLDKPMARAAQVREQVTKLAGSVAKLAAAGDADAKAIVDQFAKQGIKFSPPKDPSQTK